MNKTYIKHEDAYCPHCREGMDMVGNLIVTLVRKKYYPYYMCFNLKCKTVFNRKKYYIKILNGKKIEDWWK